MKRAIALCLCLIFVMGAFASCSGSSDNGAEISMYIGQEIRSFDPATAFNDNDAVKIFGLIYEGLTTVDENGKLQKGLASSWDITEDEEKNEYKMEITLKDSRWSDGIAVRADDFVFAWKRILASDFSSSAACLLYDIKNAQAVKAGDASIDDLAITAPDTDLIEICFEKKINYDAFLYNLASPALVPLREDKVAVPSKDENENTIYDENGLPVYSTDWCEKATALICSGPYQVKTLADSAGKEYVLERNKYYLTDEEETKDDAVVKPYKIKIHYEYTLQDVVTSFENGDLFYMSEMPFDQIANYSDDMETQDMMSTYSYLCNTRGELLSNANVRKALSNALDREYMAAITGNLDKPATGLVPNPVFDTKKGTSFREEAGNAVVTTADVENAKSLLEGKTGTITLTYRNYTANDTDSIIAGYVKGQWEQLGLTVNLEPLGRSKFAAKYNSGEYDIIVTDYQTNSVDAFSTLAPFALQFSGSAVTAENNYALQPGVTGYTSEAYNTLINDAFACEAFSAERAAKLHEAEKLLMQDSPIIPLLFNCDYYVSQDLSKISASYYGFKTFTKTKLKNYKDHLETEAETVAVSE